MDGVYLRMVEEFKRVRVDRGDSLREAAEVAGVSASTLSRVERGVNVNVTLETVYGLARYMQPENPAGEIVKWLMEGESDGAE